ncbi:PASTA domain-containing protein [Erysipelothrix sp. HDW6C]|uniref:PASTA domain-containing protein n=1 Tax=Erysipelothrix sp. HDW6C TaxID=2714930 RepID=UPI001409AB98|nr:PASTA domain-containing protein [Erysipelothrix sp. HDW6C]QIK70312.1 PASTA domain-containing protein [Erysipelothrix sp. HDW6C]
MSDFLNKFSKENYEKEEPKKSEEPKAQSSKPVEPTETATETHAVETEVEVVDNGDEVIVVETIEEVPDKKETLQDLKRQDATSKDDEEVEIDPTYKNKKKKQRLIIAAVVTALIIVSGLFYYFTSYVTLPSFVDKPIAELQEWSREYKMKIDVTEAYSIEKDKGVILSQETPADKKIKKGSTIYVTASMGADPDETVPLADFSKMKLDEIQAWVDTNRMDNIKVIQEYSDTIAKNEFIRVDIRDKEVTADKFKRKNGANIYVSKGKEEFEKNIKVPNFKGKSKGEVEAWHKEQKFVSEFTYEEVYDDKVDAGMIISQSLSEDTMVAKDAPMHFVISKGKAAYVPDYSGMSLAEFQANQGGSGVSATLKEWYSESYSYGTFLEQSVAAGTNIIDSPETVVYVYYSIGRPYLGKVTGMNEGELAKFFYDFREKGANITYSVIYKNSCEPKGTVFEVDRENQFISMNDHIYLAISNGTGTGCTPGQ